MDTLCLAHLTVGYLLEERILLVFGVRSLTDLIEVLVLLVFQLLKERRVQEGKKILAPVGLLVRFPRDASDPIHT
jgi:hypothetical protein